MAQYVDEPGISISAELKPQFGDVEQFSSLLQLREEKKSYWERVGVGGSITANPTIYNDIIYIGSCDKNFYAVGLDGKEKWRFETNGMIQASALATGGAVYFGSTDNNFYALDAETGKVRWKFQTTGPVRSIPVMHEGKLYFSTSDGKLYCLNNGGKELWSSSTSGALATPLIVNNRIFAGYEDCNMHCFDMSGRPLWKFKTGAFIAAWPAAYHDRKVIFGSWDKNVYALDMDGKLVWKFIPKETPTAPVVWKDRVYVGTTGSNLYCLEAANGKQVWDFKKNFGTMANPLVVDSMVYCGSYDNNLYCIDALTGELVWKFETNGFIHGMPAVGKGLVVFGSWDCNLYAVSAEDGKKVWKFPTSLSNQSSIEPPEDKQSKVAEVVWTPETKEEKKKYKDNEVDIADYGTFSGNYIDVGKTSYMKESKKGYLK